MMLSENCKNCIYGYTVKCESGEEYIVCDCKECQEEKNQNCRADMRGKKE